MKRLFILEGKNTPRVLFDPENNQFEISGKSYSEHARKFYAPVFEWLKKFEPETKTICINFKFHYISTSSILVISEMLKTFALLESTGCRVTGKWHFDKDDEDLLTTGKDLASLEIMNLELVPY